jgi:hypothetical protein
LSGSGDGDGDSIAGNGGSLFMSVILFGFDRYNRTDQCLFDSLVST